MKKQITLIAVLVTVAALATAPIAHARPGQGRPGFSRGPGPLGIFGHLRHLKEALDLSDQQAGQIKAIFTELREQNAPYREQMRGSFKGVADVLLANPDDVAAAQAILDQQAATERIVKMNLLNATAKAMGVLTADQRTKLKTLMDERQERRARRRR